MTNVLMQRLQDRKTNLETELISESWTTLEWYIKPKRRARQYKAK